MMERRGFFGAIAATVGAALGWKATAEQMPVVRGGSSFGSSTEFMRTPAERIMTVENLLRHRLISKRTAKKLLMEAW